jgi:hypothetical protein
MKVYIFPTSSVLCLSLFKKMEHRSIRYTLSPQRVNLIGILYSQADQVAHYSTRILFRNILYFCYLTLEILVTTERKVNHMFPSTAFDNFHLVGMAAK